MTSVDRAVGAVASGVTGALVATDSAGVMAGMSLSLFGFIAWAVVSRRQIGG